MEVKIGVQHVAREVTLESDQSPEEVTAVIETALLNGDLLRLRDERGRLVIVPVRSLGYVEIGAPERGRVGFGTL